MRFLYLIFLSLIFLSHLHRFLKPLPENLRGRTRSQLLVVRIAPVMRSGFISNDSSAGAGPEVMAREKLILPVLLDFIRVHSRPFVVQICFQSTLLNLLMSKPVFSSSPPDNSLDSPPRTSFVDEPNKHARECYRHLLNRQDLWSSLHHDLDSETLRS